MQSLIRFSRRHSSAFFSNDIVALVRSLQPQRSFSAGLRCLMSGQDIEDLKMRSDARDSWLSSVFDRADINRDGFLDEEESLKLLTVSSKGTSSDWYLMIQKSLHCDLDRFPHCHAVSSPKNAIFLSRALSFLAAGLAAQLENFSRVQVVRPRKTINNYFRLQIAQRS